MKSKVIWLMIGVVVVLCLALVSCSSGTASPTTATPTTPTTSAPVTTATTSVSPTSTPSRAPTTTTTTTSTSVSPTASASPGATTSAPPFGQPIPTNVKRGGTLKIIIGPPNNLGVPWMGNAPSDLWNVNPVIETLLLTDDKGIPTPRLATAWTIAPDNKSITFTLRKGVKFHDGTDFNAAAFKWDMEKYAGSTQTELKKVTGVDLIDDYTARVNFSQFDPSFLSFMAVGKPGWIVSPTAAQKMSDEEMLKHPVGTGPFMFKSYKQDVSVIFVKNPNYWQAGKPYLDGIEYHIIADPVTALISFRAGTEHVHTIPTPKDASDLKNMGFNVTSAQASIYQYIPDSNNPNSPFAKKEVRQAVQHAIDTVAMAKAQGYGWADPYWNQVFPKGNPAYNPDIVGYPYDPAKAKALLTQAGYPNGFNCSLYNMVPPVGDLEPAVQNYLAAVGIKAEMRPLAGAAYTQANTQGWNNGMFRSQSVASLGADPLYQLNIYLSTPPISWVSSARPPDMQALLTQANGETDTAKRVAILKDLCKNIVDTNALLVSMWGGYLLAAKDPALQGDTIRSRWTMTWTPEDAWLDK